MSNPTVIYEIKNHTKDQVHHIVISSFGGEQLFNRREHVRFVSPPDMSISTFNVFDVNYIIFKNHTSSYIKSKETILYKKFSEFLVNKITSTHSKYKTLVDVAGRTRY